MKKLLLLALVQVLLTGVAAQAQTDPVVAVKVNGGQTYLLTPQSGLYFSNDTLYVDNDSYALEEVTILTFEAYTSEISGIEALQLSLSPNPFTDVVKIEGIGSEPQRVTLYSTAGIKLHEQIVADGGTIDLSHLSEGVYVVRCGERVGKIVKQL